MVADGALVDVSTRHRVCKLATCNLNQWAMDFAGNLQRVEESARQVIAHFLPLPKQACPSALIPPHRQHRVPGNTTRRSLTERVCTQAVAAGARYRVGPELELPGYGCDDHFLEPDTVDHSWEALGQLLQNRDARAIVMDVGMPVIHRGVRYNCRVFALHGRVLLIRPKMHLADDGNYREGRYFTTWKREGAVEQHRCACVCELACLLAWQLRLASAGGKCDDGRARRACSDVFCASRGLLRG